MSNTETKQQYEGAILQQLVENAKKLAVIEFEFSQIKPKIDKIDILEQKIDAVEQKVDAVEQKVDAVEQKVDAVETKVSNLDTKVFNIDARLSNVEKLIDDIRKILNWIGGGIGAILLSLLANFIYRRFL